MVWQRQMAGSSAWGVLIQRWWLLVFKLGLENTSFSPPRLLHTRGHTAMICPSGFNSRCCKCEIAWHQITGTATKQLFSGKSRWMGRPRALPSSWPSEVDFLWPGLLEWRTGSEGPSGSWLQSRLEWGLASRASECLDAAEGPQPPSRGLVPV